VSAAPACSVTCQGQGLGFRRRSDAKFAASSTKPADSTATRGDREGQMTYAPMLVILGRKVPATRSWAHGRHRRSIRCEAPCCCAKNMPGSDPATAWRGQTAATLGCTRPEPATWTRSPDRSGPFSRLAHRLDAPAVKTVSTLVQRRMCVKPSRDHAPNPARPAADGPDDYEACARSGAAVSLNQRRRVAGPFIHCADPKTGVIDISILGIPAASCPPKAWPGGRRPACPPCIGGQMQTPGP